MKCNSKTMLTVALLLATLATVGYWTVPQFRITILGLLPFALLLICPLSMAAMMWMMNRQGHRHDSSPPDNRETMHSPQ